MKKTKLLLLVNLGLCIFLSGQNVGIGTSTPDYKLDVVGIIHNSSNAYFDGSVGIGTTSPGYKLQVNNGQIALYNSTDAKTWVLNYNSSSNYFALMEGSLNRIVVTNGGNVGIGTSVPDNRLDVVGSAQITGNTIIGGALVVNGSYGVAYNANGNANLKIYTFTTPKFTAILGPHQLSGEGSVGFGGGFVNPPKVFVGDIALTGGASGQLYMVQLILYDCTNNSCKARLLNNSSASVNYDIYWNIMCVGN
ncbi:MAG: hypothetical protein V4722_25410 [Bacteroidota bacterium]